MFETINYQQIKRNPSQVQKHITNLKKPKQIILKLPYLH